jgi:RHS repeat-associated protein
MGCLKLTYYENESPLKVVRENFLSEEKADVGAYRFGFNGMGKEKTKSSTEFRFYDPAIGRWVSVDPLFDHGKQVGISPYSFGYNSPILFGDTDGNIPWPKVFGNAINASVSSPFGWRNHPVLKVQKFHNGIDLPAAQGTSIRSLAEGKVVKVGYSKASGNFIIIDHGQGYTSSYSHIREGGVRVSVGNYVNDGDKIAEVGTTGRSTGPHLHLIINRDGKEIDPKTIPDLQDIVGKNQEIIAIDERIAEIDRTINFHSRLVSNFESDVRYFQKTQDSKRVLASESAIESNKESMFEAEVQKSILEVTKEIIIDRKNESNNSETKYN